jgi:hypothetical protein
MRYIAYGLAIFAAVLAIAFTTGNLPRDATASHNDTNDMNLLQLEQTRDAKAFLAETERACMLFGAFEHAFANTYAAELLVEIHPA